MGAVEKWKSKTRIPLSTAPISLRRKEEDHFKRQPIQKSVAQNARHRWASLSRLRVVWSDKKKNPCASAVGLRPPASGRTEGDQKIKSAGKNNCR